MSAGVGALLGGSTAARRAARSILAEGRFHQPNIPRPLHGTLVAIGRAISSPLSLINRAVSALARHLPGGVAGVWAALALAVLALSLILARRRAHRNLVAAAVDPADDRDGCSAAELERAARQAEAEGRLEDAVRLQFRAGLARLGERAAIAAETTPTAEISRRLRSASFDAVARRFGEIAYGAATAEPRDVESQRRAWPEILRAAKPR